MGKARRNNPQTITVTGRHWVRLRVMVPNPDEFEEPTVLWTAGVNTIEVALVLVNVLLCFVNDNMSRVRLMTIREYLRVRLEMGDTDFGQTEMPVDQDTAFPF